MIIMSFKKDIKDLLFEVFGKDISNTIEEEYSDDEFNEIYILAFDMLSKSIGHDMAQKKLSQILIKHPDIRSQIKK